jgi:glycosyltransferase involved in cell wall biosynthesis
MNYKLTIAIPTYNRNEILKKNLSKLLPQLSKEVVVVIYDNFSDILVSETLENELKSFDNLFVRRNKANLGLSGNLIKCIEFCDTEWVWLLGDDDEPNEAAIVNIFKYINEYPELHFVNFKSDYTLQREQDIHIKGENEFIEKIESIHNLFFMSVGLYNTKKVRPFLKFAYLYSYSVVPHFVMLLVSLKNEGEVIFSNNVVITSQGTTKEENSGWSFLPVCLGLPTITELPLKLTKKNNLKISNFIKYEFIRRPIFSLERVLQLYNLEELKVLKYNFRQPYLRLNTSISFFWK